jgi:hypothetical protein
LGAFMSEMSCLPITQFYWKTVEKNATTRA